MRLARAFLASLLLAGMFALSAFAAPFVVFPKAGQLISPDGRFVVTNVEREGSASEFIGTFRSLWVTEVATHRSRKICDYVGVAAVAWADNQTLLITQYVSRRTSRAIVFPVTGTSEPVVLDVRTLARMIPSEQRDAIEGNDHVFVEASRLEDQVLHIRVWGRGQHDPEGFRWQCQYRPWERAIACVTEK